MVGLIMSSDVHSNGLLINNEAEYKAFIIKKHPAFKMDEPISEIHTRFGKPKEYPFVLLLKEATVPYYATTEIHFIYLKSKPSVYKYYDPE